MTDDKSRSILKKLNQNVDFIKKNWQDDVARQYLISLERMQQSIQQYEKKRVLVKSQNARIEETCNKILEEIEDSPQIYSRGSRRR